LGITLNYIKIKTIVSAIILIVVAIVLIASVDFDEI